MTHRKWTSDDQEEWLKARLSLFTEAQAQKTTTSEFFPKVLTEWRKAWPVPEPTADEIAQAKNVEDAIKKKRTRDDDRVKTWFHNHTRGSTSGARARGVLKLKTKSRVLHEWQVYYQMSYESQWKAIIEKEWETHKVKLTQENPKVNLKTARFNFANAFIREKYQAETKEVKDEVKKRREKEEDANVNSEAQNKSYQKVIDKLLATLAMMGEAIQSQTGWNITFLIGGPEPINDGKIMMYMLHCGKAPDDQDFEAFLGKDGYEEHITDTFDDFLHKVFPQKVRDGRCLTSTPEAAEAAEQEANGNGEGTDNGTNKSDGAEPEESEERSVRVPQMSKSQYELTHEANITKNKELFQKLDAEYPAPKIEKKANKKASKRERTKNESQKQEPTRFSARIPGRSGTPTSVTATSTAPTSVVGSEGETKSVEASLTPNQTPAVEGDISGSCSVSSAYPPLATPSAPKVPLHPDSTALAGVVADSISAAPPLILADVNSPCYFVQATVSASASIPVAALDASGPQVVDDAFSFTPLASVVDLASSVTPVGNSASFPVNDASSLNPLAPIVNSASVPLSSHETDTKASSMDVDSDVDGEKAAKDESRLRPRSVVPAYDKSVLPAWLIKTGMLDYLHRISQEKAWQDLVNTLIKFEINLPVALVFGSPVTGLEKDHDQTGL